MPRITKGMIAAAKANLQCIHELATAPDAYLGQNATLQYHAPSANRYLAVLKQAGEPLPDFITKHGEKYMHAMGWRW